jgi:ubiquitin-protein ligase E3 C
MSTLPPGALEPNSSATVGKQVAEPESDSDSEDLTQLSASPDTPLPRLDERTSKRLQTLPAPTHINSLIRVTQNHTMARIALCDFLSALCSVWSLRIDTVLSTMIMSTGGGFVRELYRLYVRSSPLGKEVGLATLLGTPLAFYPTAYSLLTSWQTPRTRTLGSHFFS